MKVKILKTPSYQEGGIYGHGYSLSPAEAFSLLPSGYRNVGELLKSGKNLLKNTPKNKTSQPNIPQQTTTTTPMPDEGLPNLGGTGSSSLEGLLNGGAGASEGVEALSGLGDISSLAALAKNGGWIQHAINKKHVGYCTPMTKSTCTPRRKALARTFKKHHGFHQDGGETTDPQLLQAYQTIANQLLEGQDPNALVGQYVDSGMSYDDAQEVVSQVMDFMNTTSEAQISTAQIGGGVFAGQSTELSNIIAKPVMKDGGQTFVTSQLAYTQKSHNYFGTSNAPARDSYTNNQEVTTSVKAVPEEDATIEAEKGEYIFSDKGLYKILGKKHSEGGTPLAAKGGEFIFSAHKDMSLDPELQTEAGLKKPSSKALSENTPAKILERNIDVKEYNRLKVIASDPKSDKVTKKTALFMLDKFDQKIQTIAQLQEAKKQPNPPQIENQYLEQPQIQQDINEQKQYQDGGNIPVYQSGGTNPYTIQKNNGQIGVYYNDKPLFNTYFNPGEETSTGKYSSFDPSSDKLQNILNDMYSQGVLSNSIKTPSDFQQRYYDWQLQKNPETLSNIWEKYGPNNAALNDKNLKNQLNTLGVTTSDLSNGKYTMSFSGMTPENKTKALTLLGKHYPDNYVGARLLESYNTSSKEAEKINPFRNTTTPQNPSGNTDNNKGTNEAPPPNYPIIGNDYDIENPYNEVRGMEYAKYMNNLISNKPYFTYTSPVNTPRTVFRQMSRQPLLDEAARARYSVNQLSSKFGDKNQRMLAAAQQNDNVNKGLYNIEKYNTEGVTNNYNQNALRNSASLNTWNDRLKQTYDQNQNVLDKTNYANAAYYNQYMTAEEKDMLNKYYGDMDLQTSMLPYIDKNYQMPIDLRTKKINPNWRGWDTKAVEKMASNNNSYQSVWNQIKDLQIPEDAKTKIFTEIITKIT